MSKLIKKTKGRPLLSEKRSRTHCLVLYPDCVEHSQLIEDLKQCKCIFDTYAFALHDNDRFTDDVPPSDDYEGHKKGERKKPHYHVVFMFSNAMTRSAFITRLHSSYPSVTDGCVARVLKDRDEAVRYLWHADEPDKYPYDPSIVQTSNVDLSYYIRLKKSVSEGNEIIKNIMDFILDNSPDRTTLLQFVLENGWYGEYRQAYKIFDDIRKDHVCKSEIDEATEIYQNAKKDYYYMSEGIHEKICSLEKSVISLKEQNLKLLKALTCVDKSSIFTLEEIFDEIPF